MLKCIHKIAICNSNKITYTSSRYYSTQSSSLRMTIIGAPGSGKGTQSTKLKRDYGVVPISTGQILREAAEEDTPFGKEIAKKLKTGDLISNDIMAEIIQKVLNNQNNWLLDGYPRNPEQAEHLDKVLKEKDIPLTVALYLDVPENILQERIQDRWVHPKSGRVYNSVFSPPKVKGIDDVTGEPLVKRSDDNDEKVFQNRIKTFKESTLPLLKYYEKQGILYTISSPTSDEGYIKIKKVLDQVVHKE
ncbi:hypothetical protein CYY_008740 [Polysphondylium violaceum]|uniref:Adenylate kinase active site lid domain-containing protein n=1 Tax=Polysphondylium violaceum TaxID=133409 RepID=A0A8J4UX20_9MYCE|nr:hypothetical protein CYY_008740 [Polysphondylium violaceum]